MAVSAPVSFASVFEDKSGTLSSIDVIQGGYDSQFRPQRGNRTSIGITASAWWVKIKAVNPTDQPIKWVLNIPFPLTDIVDAYHVPENGSPSQFLLGDTRPFVDRPLPGEGFAMPLETSANSNSTIYFRLKFISSGAVDTYFEISSPAAYTESQRAIAMVLGFLLGGGILLFVYNAIIFLVIRSKIYLWYLAYLAATIATFITTTGLGNRYLWSHSSWLGDASPLISSAALFLFAVQFSRVLLDTRRIAPWIDRLLVTFVIIFSSVILFYFTGYREVAAKLLLVTGLGLGVLPLVGGWLWWRGSRVARLFTLAWSIWAIAVTTMIARYIGFIASNEFTQHAAWVGIIIEAMLFALALAERIRILQIDKEDAERGERIALERSKEELEQEVVRRTEQIRNQNEQVTKLNTQKDKFFYIIAHDLIGPFNSLIGLSNLLKSGAEKLGRDKIIEYSQDLNSSAITLNKLVEALLSWAMLQQNNMKFLPEDLDIHDCIRSGIDVFGPAARQKDITLEYQDDEPIIIRADRSMVDTIIRNLLNNAIKFTKTGGHIRCLVTRLGSHVKVSIRDDGIGMAPDLIGRLFDVGEKTSGTGTAGEHGTGLGLLLCEELVEVQGGSLDVESEKGVGSTFSFTLPTP